MFSRDFYFSKTSGDNKTLVSPKDLYSISKGYGFLTEETRLEQEILQIPELNSGFDCLPWYQGTLLTYIEKDCYGCYIKTQSKDLIPLTFKCNVPIAGNYKVIITLAASNEDASNIFVLTGRRRFMLRKTMLEAYQSLTLEYNVNVCDIIPRGKNDRYTDLTLDITILGKDIRLSKITVKENPSPTLFIAGDSTVTDQPGTYPYNPAHCYSGWGQAITAFLSSDIAVSNHAHSGLTTESFRSQGHFSIVMDNIKEGDYCMFQFAHNDQKLSHLKAHEGYSHNLTTYINEVKDKGATPILVTPICRNTWRGNDGTYNDLLIEYAEVCIELARTMNVPLIDLHQHSHHLITTLGLNASKGYFYPGDYTHTNDYGAYLMAHFVALELSNYFSFVVLDNYSNWIPPKEISLPIAPKDLEPKIPTTSTFEVIFTDIADSKYKEIITRLTAIGIIPNTDTAFRPMEPITRVEALAMVTKLYGFFATNVYNDMFTDVVGHEWYAGIVECACSNGIFDFSLLHDKLFHPLTTITANEFLSYCINGFKGRKGVAPIQGFTHLENTTVLTREEAVFILHEFKNLM